MSGTKDQIQDRANATINRWKRSNGAERPSSTLSFCNRCNGSGYRASDCRCSKTMVCVDCKGTRHRDRYSGYCPWNTSNFTLPVAERTPDNPKIRRPTSENSSGTYPPRINKYADNCAATVNQVIDRILHNDNTDRDQQEAAIQDASSWSEEEKRDFIQYRKSKKDPQTDRA